MINGKMYESEYEQAFVELLQNAGWNKCTFGEQLHRQITDPILEDDLRNFLNSRYAKNGFTDDDCNAAIANIRNIGGVNDYDALRNTYNLYTNLLMQINNHFIWIILILKIRIITFSAWLISLK